MICSICHRFIRAAARRAFTVVELLVAISVLTLIVLVLFTLFDQVQKALRSNAAQVDALEGGRAAIELMAREMEQMQAGNVWYITNFYAGLSARPYAQPLHDPGTARTNVIDEVFFLTKSNKYWIGTGYRVLATTNRFATFDTFEANALTLARYSFRTSESDFGNFNVFARVMGLSYLPAALVHGPPVSPIYPRFDFLTNYQAITEGVVHFRVRAYDTNGLLMAWNSTNYLANGYSNVVMTNGPGTTEETQYAFTGPALPAYVEIEMAILEPPVLERLKSMPVREAAERYFTNQVGALHLFRKRVPIRAGL